MSPLPLASVIGTFPSRVKGRSSRTAVSVGDLAGSGSGLAGVADDRR
jgi:hypothetical protein